MVLSNENDLEYLKTLTYKLTGNLFAEDASIQDYVDNIVGYFANIIYSMPNHVYWLDSQCVLRGGNNNLAHQLNLQTGADLAGLSYEQMAQAAKLPTKKLEAFRVTELDVMQTGIPSIDKEEPPIKVGEKTFYYLSNKTPLRNKKGEIVGVVGISTDITKLKKTQLDLKIALQKAETANQAKTEFLENMRHDIRTPVAGMIGCAQLIQSQPNNPEQVTEFATNLVEASEALLALLNTVLESVKVASGEIPTIKKKFDLYKLLKQLIYLNKPYAANKQLALSLDYDATIPRYVIGGSVQIQRIILELITNALKFTKEGQIKVSARLMKQEKESRQLIIKLSVSDTGIGIALDQQTEVYTRFKRLTPAYQGIYAGTGLGLSVVKQFMDDLGGELSLESQPNHGSTFTCLIPLQEPLLMDSEGVEELLPIENKALKKTLVRNKPLRTPSNATGRRILVVEDHAIAAKIAQQVLAQLHYQVDVAESAKIALTLLKKNYYDLVLMDIGLPDTNGEELTHQLLLQPDKHNPSLPVIGLTAHIDAGNTRRCIDAGMSAVYAKPLTTEKALEIVHAFIPEHTQLPSSAPSLHAEVDIFKGLAILDINRARQFMGNKQFLKEGLALLVSSLTEELGILKKQHQKKDWQAIKALAHKWRGGASYCGARRLEKACEQLETALQTGAACEQAEDLYQQLIRETEATKEASKQYISNNI